MHELTRREYKMKLKKRTFENFAPFFGNSIQKFFWNCGFSSRMWHQGEVNLVFLKSAFKKKMMTPYFCPSQSKSSVNDLTNFFFDFFSYMTAGGSLSLIGSSSLRFPGPFRLALESPRSEEGRKRYKIIAKATHNMAIMAKPLSPVPWLGPGSPS